MICFSQWNQKFFQPVNSDKENLVRKLNLTAVKQQENDLKHYECFKKSKNKRQVFSDLLLAEFNWVVQAYKLSILNEKKQICKEHMVKIQSTMQDSLPVKKNSWWQRGGPSD